LTGLTTLEEKTMGAKYPGKGVGRMTGGSSRSESGKIVVTMTAQAGRALLESVSSGQPLPKDLAKTVSLAVVRALDGGGGIGGKSKGSPKLPVGTPKTFSR